MMHYSERKKKMWGFNLCVLLFLFPFAMEVIEKMVKIDEWVLHTIIETYASNRAASAVVFPAKPIDL